MQEVSRTRFGKRSHLSLGGAGDPQSCDCERFKATARANVELGERANDRADGGDRLAMRRLQKARKMDAVP